MARAICLMLAPFLLLLSACSPYVEGIRFVPRPALADIPATQPQDAPPVSVVVSIVGIHRQDTKAGIPESVEVAMQVENNSSQTISLDPQSMKLSNGMTTFRPPTVNPATPITLAPMATANIDTYFPFPVDLSWDETDLNWLQLSWIVQLEGRNVRQVVNFQRVHYYNYYYSDPYWDYPHVWVGGAVIVHRR